MAIAWSRISSKVITHSLEANAACGRQCGTWQSRMGVYKQHLENVRRKDVLPRLRNDRATCLLRRLFRLGLRRFCYNIISLSPLEERKYICQDGLIVPHCLSTCAIAVS